jgi:hypothetical protein
VCVPVTVPVTKFTLVCFISVCDIVCWQGLPVTGNKQELVERLQAAVGSDLLDENDDDLDQEEEEQLSDEAIKKAEAELQAQGDTSFSEVEDHTPKKTGSASEVDLFSTLSAGAGICRKSKC